MGRFFVTTRTWIKASRPLAHANIAPPLVWGQAMAGATTGRFDPWMAAAVHGWGVLVHLFIVYANDYADRDTDLQNQTFGPFSGGSRVLPDGDLKPSALAGAAIAAGTILTVFSITIDQLTGRPSAVYIGFMAIVLVWAYSYRPFGCPTAATVKSCKASALGSGCHCSATSVKPAA